MGAKFVNKKKYYGALATIGIVGGISVLAVVVLKKPKLKIVRIDETQENGKVVSKKYEIQLGLRKLEIVSNPNERDNIKINLPLYVYEFNTTDKLDSDGIPSVELKIKNRASGKTETKKLDAL